MPLDGTNFVTPKEASEVTLRELIAWLETKRPSERYFYANASNCLWAQYLKEHGSAKYIIGPREMPGGIHGWGYKVAIGTPHTFGAALKRARRYLPWHERLRGVIASLFQEG